MAKRPPASTAIVMIAMELIAVAAFVLLAGISENVGKAVLIIMSGFWLITLLMNPRAPVDLANAIVTLVFDPSNSGRKVNIQSDQSSTPGLEWPTGVYNPLTNSTPQ